MKRLALLLVALMASSVTWAQDTDVPLLRTSLEQNTAIPGQPLLYRVTILTPTWMPSPPVFSTIEAPNVMVRLPSRASGPTSERIDGETWSGISRSYRLYPMIPGRFQIPSGSIKVIYADPETQQPVEVVLETKAFEIIGEVPNGTENLVPFLAAGELTLDRKVEGDPNSLRAGDALTITTTANIAGVPPMFVPPLVSPLEVEGLSSYAKEPALEEKEDRGVPSGSRTEVVTIVAENAGRYEIPEVALSWYDLDSGKIETATLPAISISVSGASEPTAPPKTDFDWRTTLLASLIAVFAIAVLFTIGRWSVPRLAAVSRQSWLRFKASEAYSYLVFKRQIQKNDFNKIHLAGLEWRMRMNEVDPNIDWTGYEIAFMDLGKGAFEQERIDQSGTDMERRRVLVRAVQSIKRQSRKTAKTRRRNSLPELNPSSQS